MSTGSINNLSSSSYLQSLLNIALQGAGSTANSTTNTASAASASLQASTSQLSPFAQLMSTLQNLQQSDPAKYQQVTQQIATNFQTAAQTATSEGNATAARQLAQLSTDFTTASKTGEPPNIQDLAQAVSGGGHHHHHHSQAAAADSDSDAAATGVPAASSAASPTSQTLSQMLAAFEANATQNNALNPRTIILNTLTSAGITGANAG